jgi:hypothetical protein
MKRKINKFCLSKFFPRNLCSRRVFRRRPCAELLCYRKAVSIFLQPKKPSGVSVPAGSSEGDPALNYYIKAAFIYANPKKLPGIQAREFLFAAPTAPSNYPPSLSPVS